MTCVFAVMIGGCYGNVPWYRTLHHVRETFGHVGCGAISMRALT